jgi:hypothetical protein
MSPPSPYRGRAPQVEDEEGTCSVFLIITPLVLLLNFNRPRSQPSYHSLLLAPKFSLNKPTVLVSFICSLLQCGSVVLVQLLAPSSASHSGLNHRSVARVREEATGPIVLRTAAIARRRGEETDSSKKCRDTQQRTPGPSRDYLEGPSGPFEGRVEVLGRPPSV